MAMIHEKLYQSPDLTHVNIKDYIESFVSNLFYSYKVKKGVIEPIMNVDNIEMGIDTAIPLGLIINELITNSLKHAFPERKDGGEIQISLKKEADLFTLKIADNGVGMPEKEKIENKKSLGLQLVSSLVNQLDGTMIISGKDGAEFKVLFEELKYKKRM